MARERSQERDRARQVWLDSGGKMTASEVAEQVGVKPAQIRKWKSLDKWNDVLETQKPPRKRGGQPGNKNAAGAGAPYQNKNAQIHGAYSVVHLADLTPEQREYIQNITLDTQTNMLTELQRLLAKETDLQQKIMALQNGDADALYIDRVIQLQVPKDKEKLKHQQDKLNALQQEYDDLLWQMDENPEKPPTKQQENKLKRLQRDIAELQDQTEDAERELERSGFKTSSQTIMKASAFEREMKLEAEQNKIHGRIIKLLDSIKSYELEMRRVHLEERKYNLAKQRLAGVLDVDLETGEINDDNDDAESIDDIL